MGTQNTRRIDIRARLPDPNPIHSLRSLSLHLEQTRAGMYKILGEDVSSQLKAKDTPGVFIQGLVVYSGAGDEVLYERLLDAETVSQVASFCEERGVSLIAYSGDSIVSLCVFVCDGRVFCSAFLFCLLACRAHSLWCIGVQKTASRHKKHARKHVIKKTTRSTAVYITHTYCSPQQHPLVSRVHKKMLLEW